MAKTIPKKIKKIKKIKEIRKAPSSADSGPPFLPLEESGKMSGSNSEQSFDTDGYEEETGKISDNKCQQMMIPKVSGKTIFLSIFALLFFLALWESFFVAPEDRLIKPDFSDKFLLWVQSNPGSGLWAICLVIAGGVVTMVPVGTPLTLGCGYIYRGVYGWKLGMFVATVVSMSGSCLGAITCFLIGRYLMRDTVKTWARKYPLFDAIDVAASEQGLKIMAMLYLTPVLPLGLVSYMCGTTSMSIISFVVAKIASLPLYLIYTFIGASAHSLIKRGKDASVSAALAESKQMEENQTMLVFGLLLSIVMMTLITRHIRKELMKILEQQKGKAEADGNAGHSEHNFDENAVEMGLVARRRGHK